MVSGFLLVLVGNILRLGAGLLVIVLLARQLGPQAFGVFGYGLAIATLATMLLNFGLSPLVLRRFGAEPAARADTLGQALSARLTMLAPLALISLAALLLLPAPVQAVTLPLLLAQIAESFSELYQLGFRAGERYREEAATASAAAAIHIVVMTAVAWVWPTASACAWAFMGSRVTGLLLTAWRAQAAFGRIAPSAFAAGLRLLRDAMAYAVEFGINTAATQLDAVLIQAQLGLRALGIYQAGMKLVQGVSRLAPILALYLLPRLTRGVQIQRLDGKAGPGGEAVITLSVFGSLGALAGGLLALGAEPLTRWLFGANYAGLVELLPWFGLLLALRFVETGAGLVLVAADLQRSKVWLVAAQLLLLLTLGSWALSRWGVLGWLWVAIGSTLALLFAYVGLWRRSASAPR